MAYKDFKTLDEQVKILKSRGLKIPNEEEAKAFLLRNNYYRVSGYSLTLRKHDVFFPSATFDNLVDIYQFDHELRHLLLKYIELIEVSVKSVYSYEFTKVYGPTGYLNPEYFTDAKKHGEIIQKAEQQKASRLAHEAYLKHFIEELQEDVPLWAYVDLFTISDISFFYAISEPEIQKAVASDLGIEKQGPLLLGKFMHSMTIIRNLCAHGSRLYNRLFEQRPKLSKEELSLLRIDQQGRVDNSHLFSFILIMRRLLPYEEFRQFSYALWELTRKYPFVNMKYYGFPETWEDSL